jgi:acetate kinase
MNVLVFNCGSSSLKYRLIAMPEEREIASGEAQRVGPPTAEPSRITHRTDAGREVIQVPMADHSAAFDEVMKLLRRDPKMIPDVFGHRLVHGGTLFTAPTIVDDAVMAGLESIAHLAPLHNPPAMKLIRACRAKAPELPEVAVFDTSFHATIPEYARTYALPERIRERLGIRKYGFHGTSHQFVAEEAAKFLGKPMSELNAVSCHLGSGGSSLCAIVNGRSVDNTMGFSPLQGLVMSTRCGDLDPAVVLRMLTQSRGESRPVEELLNKKSGVLGMTGVSADIRDVFAATSKDAPSRMDAAAQVYLWRMRKYLGAYLAVVGRADAIIFTDTIGETVPLVRWTLCTGMDVFGVKIDTTLNNSVTRYPADVAAKDSPVRILVILTNEELAIARRTYSALAGAATR